MFIITDAKLVVSSIFRGSYMSAHVLLNLLNELRKSLFRNEFDEFNYIRA